MEVPEIWKLKLLQIEEKNHPTKISSYTIIITAVVLGSNKKSHHGYRHNLPHGYHDNQG